MTVPTPSYTKDDFTVSPFTTAGSPTLASDQHGSDNTFVLNGINQNIQNATDSPTISSASTKASGSLWINTTATGGFILAERPTSYLSGGAYDASFTASGEIQMAIRNKDAGSHTVVSQSSTSFNDGLWHLFTWVFDINGVKKLKLFKDEAEVLYSFQDTLGGSFTTFGTLAGPLMYGALNPGGSAPWAGTPSRPRVWDNVALTNDEVAENYNNEIAAISTDNFEQNFLLLET